jgi:ubiquitin C-terminal hydrolase
MKGFRNIGNTCYLNSGLQMLVQNDNLYNLVTKYMDMSQPLTIIGNFMKEYRSPDNDTALVPSEIKKMIEERQEIFIGMGQQDSTEFIVFFLDIIDEEIRKIDKSTEFRDIFGIEINTRTKCKIRECLTISNRKEHNNFLLLDMDHNFNSLDDIYRNFKSSERMEDDNMYYCDNCKAKRIASKRYNIEKWAPHTYIWLKRYKQVGRTIQKIGKMIDVPLEWRHNMVLQGAVIHYGNLNGGHYVYVGKYNDKWYLYDDSSVSEISSIEKLKGLLGYAYWLYYIHL